MSLDQLLAGLENQESGSGDGDVSFVSIAKVRVFFGWEGFSNDARKYFEYIPGDADDRLKAQAECKLYTDTDTISQYSQFPKDGICTEIYGDDIPTHKDGKLEWGTFVSFANQYESDANISKLTSNFPQEEQAKEQAEIAGPMPYNLVIEALKDHLAISDWKPHWCKLEQKINQWQKFKGKKNKKGYDWRVYVIQHVYENEAEAKADAEVIKASNAQPQIANDGAQLSAEAIETWKNLAALKKQKYAIQNTIERAIMGIGVTAIEELGIAANEKLNEADAQAYAAEGYGIKPEDLLLIGIGEAPF